LQADAGWLVDVLLGILSDDLDFFAVGATEVVGQPGKVLGGVLGGGLGNLGEQPAGDGGGGEVLHRGVVDLVGEAGHGSIGKDLGAQGDAFDRLQRASVPRVVVRFLVGTGTAHDHGDRVTHHAEALGVDVAQPCDDLPSVVLEAGQGPDRSHLPGFDFRLHVLVLPFVCG